jgi:hypothetical protein
MDLDVPLQGIYFMKKIWLIISFIVLSLIHFEPLNAQCSICAKTTQQLGDKPAKGFNSGIIYLMLTPFAVMGYVGYRWFKNNQSS